uniref:hypothetical protein n=1 Tax=Pseudonocardia sp. CA-138482 TaxID=3240023 RepID=UPI003F490BCF
MPAPRPLYGLSVDQIALVAATAKSVLEIRTPASTGIVPVLWWVEFDGIPATNPPVKVEVGIFSAAVTTATSITPALINFGNRGLASQCTCNQNTSAEGAGTASIVEIHRIPPTSGLIWTESLGMEMAVGASSFWRVRLTAAQAVNATVGVRWTE